jgi:hypothetical protein
MPLPTAFVTIEEVLRFCIVDLGARALDRNWHDVLTKSYQMFKGDFARAETLREAAVAVLWPTTC